MREYRQVAKGIRMAAERTTKAMKDASPDRHSAMKNREVAADLMEMLNKAKKDEAENVNQ